MMPDNIFKRWIESLPLKRRLLLWRHHTTFALEKRKADIAWRLIPDYYKDATT